MPSDLQPSVPSSSDSAEGVSVPHVPPRAFDPVGEAPVSNLVLLTGRLTDPAERRELAGGIPVVRWTLRVPRGTGPSVPSGSDLLDCVVLEAELQRRALTWPIGLPVTVVGAVRRRFFRSGGRTTTRVEIEVARVTELDEPAPEEPAPEESASVEPTLPGAQSPASQPVTESAAVAVASAAAQ